MLTRTPAPPAAPPDLLLVVLVGGAAGALLRYGLAEALPASRFPLATFVTNVSGALALGVLLEVLAARPDEGRARLLRLGLGSGLLGAFTTYSTLAVDGVLLVRDGHTALAAAYALGSVVLGLLAAAASIAAVRRWRA